MSFCNALGTFFKYAKIYETQKNASPQHKICKNNIAKNVPPSLSTSLIVTTYNQKENLALVLDSIKNLAFLPSEVIVADDGSKEDTRDLILSYAKSFPCPLKHAWQEDKGFRAAKSRNNAIKNAIGEYIIIIDGDMILEPHFVLDHLRYAARGVVLQGSRILLKQNQRLVEYSDAFLCKNLKSRRIAPLSLFVYKTSTCKKDFFDKKDFIRGIRSCNMSFFKKDCEKINGFNEEFIGWGREDSEFVVRFLFNGGGLKRLKFAGIAYHIYHDENPRDCLESNHNIYLNTLKNRLSWCKKGLKTAT